MDVGLFLFFIGKWLYRRVIFFRGLCNALFLKLCLLTVVALPLAAAGIIYLAVDSAPRSIAPPRSRRRISSTPNAFSNKTISDSLNLARRTIWVSASDLDLAANYLSRQYAAGERRKIPEFMPAKEFIRRFGGVDTPKYKQMMAQIERRFATLPLYR